MQNQTVIKRNGQPQNFDLGKIKQTLEYACRGFDLDQNKILNKLPDFVKDGISTAKLLKDLTLAALSLTSVEEPDWKNAAGRLRLFAGGRFRDGGSLRPGSLLYFRWLRSGRGKRPVGRPAGRRFV